MATRCIEAGILPKTVQKYFGHAALQMTMDLYVHVTEKFKQKELEKLNTVFPEKTEWDKERLNQIKKRYFSNCIK